MWRAHIEPGNQSGRETIRETRAGEQRKPSTVTMDGNAVQLLPPSAMEFLTG